VAGALAEERVDWSSIQVDPSGSPKNRNLSKEHVRTFAEHTTGPGTPALGSDVCRDIGATVCLSKSNTKDPNSRPRQTTPVGTSHIWNDIAMAGSGEAQLEKTPSTRLRGEW